MKLGIVAIGRPGRGPEATLADDYARRATLAGRALGLGPLELIDLEPRKPGKAPEAELILGAAEGAHLIACDERGRTYSSRAFADHVATLRDRGERRVVFAVGGIYFPLGVLVYWLVSNTWTMVQPDRSATSVRMRSWFSVVC